MQRPTTESALGDFVVTHPLDPEDGSITAASRATASSMKGKLRGIEAREPFDAMMERVLPRDDVTFEADTVGGIPGLSGFIPYIVDLTRRSSICHRYVSRGEAAGGRRPAYSTLNHREGWARRGRPL